MSEPFGGEIVVSVTWGGKEESWSEMGSWLSVL